MHPTKHAVATRSGSVALATIDPELIVCLASDLFDADCDVYLYSDASSLLSGLAEREFVCTIFDVALGGEAAIEAMMMSAPQTVLVVVSAAVNSAELSCAILHGASAYLSTREPAAIARAVHALCRNVALFDLPTLQATVGPVFSLRAGNSLTSAERRVLHLITLGMSNAQIAEHLDISLNTVKTHVRRVLSKLGANDRTQAAIWALRQPRYHPLE